MSSPIYLDNSATTRVREEVVEAMLPYLTENWGNPSSIHSYGRQSQAALAKARQQLANFLCCEPEEIYFTPSGTYSNNIAILGRARFAEANGAGRHLITTQIEHPAIAGPAKYLEANGWRVTYLPVDDEGRVDVVDFEKAITPETSIISIMWANNEIGTLQDIPTLAGMAKERDIYFHTDAIQVPGRLPIDLSKTNVSALSLSGHKFYAPKGIGALFLRRCVNAMPLVFGGGQERGLFPGTEGLSNVVALGKAAELCAAESAEKHESLRAMQKILMDELLKIDGVKLTGAKNLEWRLPGHLSVAVPGAEGEALVMRADLKGICISSGSACHKGIIEPSHVLKATGLSNFEAMGSARITAGRYNTEEECLRAAKILAEIFRTCPKTTGPACTTRGALG